MGTEEDKSHLNDSELDCIKIEGDIMSFEHLIDPSDRDCAMFIESLETLTMIEVTDLIYRLQKTFVKIIAMVAKVGSWTADSLKSLGFQEIIVIPYYDTEKGYIFVVWEEK